MIGAVLARFWPHLLAGAALAALPVAVTRCTTNSEARAVAEAALKNEAECVAPSYCRQALTAYERDTAQAATTAVVDAANAAGKAADELQRRRAEIEEEMARERQRQARVLASTQRQLEEAIARDPTCKDWLDQPVGCPVTDASELWTPDPVRGGFIDRSGQGAADEVSTGEPGPDAPAVHSPPGEAGIQP
jgi:hypothetical protein